MVDMIGQHWLPTLAALAGLAVVWTAAILSKYVRLMLNILRDTPPPLLMGPFDFERIEGRIVHFRAYDGTPLRGMFLSHRCFAEHRKTAGSADPACSLPIACQNTLTEDSRGVILFCHEFGSDLYSCNRYCRPLLEAGFDIFTFDFRSHGQSGHLSGYEPRLWPTDKEAMDCLGAITFVQGELDEKKLPHKLGIFGISRGAGAAIMAAAQADAASSISAMVVDGAFSTDTTLEWSMKRWVHLFAKVRIVYENHPEAFWKFIRWLLLRSARSRFRCQFPSVRKLTGTLRDTAILFIHGQKDSYIKPDQAQLLYDLARPPKYLWIVPEAKHNQSAVTAADQYAARTVAFFEKYLNGRNPSELGFPRELQEDVERFFAGDQGVSCAGTIRKESSHGFRKVIRTGDANSRPAGGDARPSAASAIPPKPAPLPSATK